jgi:hypothetical protein
MKDSSDDEGLRELAIYSQEKLAKLGYTVADGSLYSYQWHSLKHFFYNQFLIGYINLTVNV